MDAPDTLTGLPPGVTLRRMGLCEIMLRSERAEWLPSGSLHDGERTRFEGNRRARRKAAAQERKATVPETPSPISPDAIRAMFAAAEAETRRNKLLADRIVDLQRHREWQAVQALQGVIIDTATPDSAPPGKPPRLRSAAASRRPRSGGRPPHGTPTCRRWGASHDHGAP